MAAIPREQADPHSLRLRDMYGSDRTPLTATRRELPRAHGYYAAISYVDERVGEVLRRLEDTGLADDTVVIFTSDHGEMLGERGLWYKMSFFDGSARVPLIVRGPGVARAAGWPARVSQLDLAPTHGGAAPAPRPATTGFEGASLAAVLRGEAPAPLGRGRVPGRGRARAGCDDPPRPRTSTCTPGRPRPPVRPRRRPATSSTIWPTCRAAALVAAFRAEVGTALGPAIALERDGARQPAPRRRVGRALARGAHTPWDFQPYTDASVQLVRGDAAANERPWRLRPRGDLPASDG